MSGQPVSRRSGADSVLYVAGYGTSLTVNRGALVIHDGIGSQRTTRRLYRGDRTVRRILVHSATGTISLAAMRWCLDVGIALICLDPGSSEILAINAPQVHDD